VNKTSRLRALIVGIGLPLALGIATVPVLAHGKSKSSTEASYAPIGGRVTAMDGNTLQVLTKTGTRSVNLTNNTSVTRRVSGSLNDVHAAQHVEIHVVQGTSTVDGIWVSEHPATAQHLFFDNSRDPIHSKGSASRKNPTIKTSSPRGAGTSSHHLGGVVVSVTPTTITLRGRHNEQFTYALSNSVKVTSEVLGTLNDLAIGETVQVHRGHDGNAAAITILSA
jgi:hypothetical protein